jgi:hypothetical protein
MVIGNLIKVSKIMFGLCQKKQKEVGGFSSLSVRSIVPERLPKLTSVALRFVY